MIGKLGVGGREEGDAQGTITKIKAQELWFNTEKKAENIITVWMTSE